MYDRLFAEAEIAKFSRTELREYEDSMKAYRDIKNSIDTAKLEGRAEGRAEGRIEGRAERNLEIARKMLAKGLSIQEIAELTDLQTEDLDKLKSQI